MAEKYVLAVINAGKIGATKDAANNYLVLFTPKNVYAALPARGTRRNPNGLGKNFFKREFTFDGEDGKFQKAEDMVINYFSPLAAGVYAMVGKKGDKKRVVVDRLFYLKFDQCYKSFSLRVGVTSKNKRRLKRNAESLLERLKAA